METIRFEQVTRRYGPTVAVDRLDLTIPSGELFAFLGPNGAGKTTTIKMLVGLLRPSAGRVFVCGHDTVLDPRQTTRHIGYVSDEPYLYDKLSGREFLEFVAEMRGLEQCRLPETIARQCEQFAMDGFLDDLTETYSHGMKQRLVFASALLHDPPVLVVDEPMVGLDPKSVRPDITPRVISSVGNYAITISWNDGHSTGIYSFECLRALGELDAGKVMEDV